MGTPHMRGPRPMKKRQLAIKQRKKSHGSKGKKPAVTGKKPNFNQYYNHGHYQKPKTYQQKIQDEKLCENNCRSHSCTGPEHPHESDCYHCHSACANSKSFTARMKCDQKCSSTHGCQVTDIVFPNPNGSLCSASTQRRCACIQTALDKDCSHYKSLSTKNTALINHYCPGAQRNNLYQNYCGGGVVGTKPKVTRKRLIQ